MFDLLKNIKIFFYGVIKISKSTIVGAIYGAGVGLALDLINSGENDTPDFSSTLSCMVSEGGYGFFRCAIEMLFAKKEHVDDLEESQRTIIPETDVALIALIYALANSFLYGNKLFRLVNPISPYIILAIVPSIISMMIQNIGVYFRKGKGVLNAILAARSKHLIALMFALVASFTKSLGAGCSFTNFMETAFSDFTETEKNTVVIPLAVLITSGYFVADIIHFWEHFITYQTADSSRREKLIAAIVAFIYAASGSALIADSLIEELQPSPIVAWLIAAGTTELGVLTTITYYQKLLNLFKINHNIDSSKNPLSIPQRMQTYNTILLKGVAIWISITNRLRDENFHDAINIASACLGSITFMWCENAFFKGAQLQIIEANASEASSEMLDVEPGSDSYTTIMTGLKADSADPILVTTTAVEEEVIAALTIDPIPETPAATMTLSLSA